MYIPIIRKALEQAQKNGMNFPVKEFFDELEASNPPEAAVVAACLPLIYSHSFAKFLWGSADKVEAENNVIKSILPAWRYHLVQMVLSEDPVLYMADHSDEYETIK